MILIMAAPQIGITILIIILVVVFFQVIIHNTQEKERFKEIQKHLKNIEEKLNRTELK